MGNIHAFFPAQASGTFLLFFVGAAGRPISAGLVCFPRIESDCPPIFSHFRIVFPGSVTEGKGLTKTLDVLRHEYPLVILIIKKHMCFHVVNTKSPCYTVDNILHTLLS